MAGKKPNWKAIKADYLSGIKEPDLVAKYGVKDATLKSRIYREKWRDEKDQVATILHQEMPRKIADAIMAEAEEVARRHFSIWQRGLEKAEAMLDGTRRIVDREGGVFEAPAIDSAKDLREWAAAVKAATEGQRLAREMDKKKEEDPTGGKPTGLIVVPQKTDNWQELLNDAGDDMEP